MWPLDGISRFPAVGNRFWPYIFYTQNLKSVSLGWNPRYLDLTNSNIFWVILFRTPPMWEWNTSPWFYWLSKMLLSLLQCGLHEPRLVICSFQHLLSVWLNSQRFIRYYFNPLVIFISGHCLSHYNSPFIWMEHQIVVQETLYYILITCLIRFEDLYYKYLKISFKF